MSERPVSVNVHLRDVAVGGDLTVVGQRNYYEASSREFRLAPFADRSTRLPSVDQARKQPSQLLDARLGVVGFTGRGRELAWLEAWRDGAGGLSVSAVLIHGEGGSGKTRLARQFAVMTADAAWTVWEADLFGWTTPLPDRLVTGREQGVLLLVDYAERWPMNQLLGLVLHPLIADATMPVRLVLLSRSAGNWWSALAHRLGRQDVACDERVLSPSPGGLRAAPRMFAAARDKFCELLEVPDRDAIVAPDLSHRDFELVLGVHMAALVAVDAQLRGDGVPDDPAKLSAYLLARERDAWRNLPPAGNQRPRSSPETLARTVYTAVLAGPLPTPDAVTALKRAGLADIPPAAQSLLDDHRLLYPERDPGTSLEPLYPDRLAEDFLALSTPPHDRADSPPDPWAADAPAALLTPDGPGTPGTPPWSRSGMTVLIETSRRWTHVRRGQLYPLLREHPGLALAAGPAALMSLVELADLPPDVLDAIEAVLPDVSDFEYDLAFAAIAQRAVARRLSAATDAAERAALRKRLGWRYSVAGLNQRALEQYEEAVRLFRALADRSKLADVLGRLGYVLAGLGRYDDALAAAEEAVQLRKRGDRSSPDFVRELASAQLGLGYRLAALGRHQEARAVREEALAGYRNVAEADPQVPSRGIAVATTSLAQSLWTTGELPKALRLAREGVEQARQLAEANPNAHLGLLGETLRVLTYIISDTNQSSERLMVAQEAVTLYRSLAKANPNAHQRSFAETLQLEARALANTARFRDALTSQEESVLIWRVLAESDPESYRVDLALALDSYSNLLSGAGRPDDGLAAAQECVGLLRSAPHPDSAEFIGTRAEVIATLGRRLAETGQHAAAIDELHKAMALQRDMMDESDLVWIFGLTGMLCTLADQHRALGQDAESRAAAEEAIALLRTRTADPGAGELDTMARALNCLARVAERTSDGNAEALAARQEAVDILHRLQEADPEHSQLVLMTTLCELSWSLSLGGRATEALPVTAEAVSLALALAKADPDGRRLQGLFRALMEYVYVRWETGQQLPEALDALDQAERLLRLPSQNQQPGHAFDTSLGHVLELRADILPKLGRRDEALEARRAIEAQKSFDKALAPDAKGVRLLFRLAEMTELDQPNGVEALAVRMLAAEEGSTDRYLAQRMLNRRLRREKRASRGALVPAAAPTPGPDAASLLADITAIEAVDPERHVFSRREKALELVKLGDPRGTEILVAQALDIAASYRHREAAAGALIKAGDPRGKYLLSDVLTERIADPRTGWFHRRAATDQLRGLGDPDAEELSARTATGSAVAPTASREPLWQLAVQPNPRTGLTGVSSASLTALETLAATRARPPRSWRRERLTRWLSALVLPLPPALMLLTGASVTWALHSHPGPGNWVALCVSAFIFYVVAHESTSSVCWFAVRGWHMGVSTKWYFLFCYVLLMPIAAIAGFLLALSTPGFLHPAAKFFWSLLIWR
jgi:tetratricopeptide (TPR) repeat protein